MGMSQVQCQGCDALFPAQRRDAKWCPQCRTVVNKGGALRYEVRQRHSCPDCSVSIARLAVRCRKCAAKHRSPASTGANNPQWKGGRRKDIYGYVQVYVGPRSAGYRHPERPEHHLVWEDANGPLPKGYVVHHLNHVKDDNRLENLIAMSRATHNQSHGEQRILELEAEVARLRKVLDGKTSAETY